MTQLLEIREWIKRFCGKYEVYLVPIGKFLLAAITFALINGKMGYMTKIAKFPVVIILALLCSFMPMNFIIIVGALLILAHLYALSLECMVIVAVVFLVMFLLYFRFSPKDTFAVLLTPICFVLKIPYVMPMSMGLVGTPASAVSVGCGVIVYYLLYYVNTCATNLPTIDMEEVSANFKTVIDYMVGDKEMVVTLAAFVLTVLIVYFIRRMNIDHSWTIAIIVGGLFDVLFLLGGDLVFTTNIPILGTLLGTVVAVIVTKIIQFFVFNLDYARTEKVQFEDDEYYYYVKAVPKVMLTAPNKKRKKVSGTSDKLPGIEE